MEGEPGNEYNGYVPLPPEFYSYTEDAPTDEDRLFDLISKHVLHGFNTEYHTYALCNTAVQC